MIDDFFVLSKESAKADGDYLDSKPVEQRSMPMKLRGCKGPMTKMSSVRRSLQFVGVNFAAQQLR